VDGGAHSKIVAEAAEWRAEARRARRAKLDENDEGMGYSSATSGFR
jgi:hypothetical protein